jgi:GAF domain-containing protein
MTNLENESIIPLPSKQNPIINEYNDYEYLLRQVLRREKLVSKIASKIRRSLKSQEVLNTSVEEIRHFLKTDRVLMYKFDKDWSGSIVVEAVGSEWMSIIGQNIKDECFEKEYAQLYKNGRVKAIEDVYIAGLALCHIQLLVQLQVRANLVVPLIYQEDLWGLLIVHHCQKPRKWEDTEIEVLKQLSIQLAIAIQQADLYEKLQVELNSHILDSSQYHSAVNALTQLKSLLNRDDIDWDNLANVVKEALTSVSQGKVSWKNN